MNSELKKKRDKLLTTIQVLVNESKIVADDELKNTANTLYEDVRALFKDTELHEKQLEIKISQLTQDVSTLKVRIQSLESTLFEGQATWMWESHVARFIIEPTERLSKFAKYRQMMKRLEEDDQCENQIKRWKKIQEVLKVDWKTEDQYETIECIRKERGKVAHPFISHLDKVEKTLKNDATDDEKKVIDDIMNMLKLTASLMKFGRLAKDFQENITKFSHIRLNEKTLQHALQTMADYDRDFHQLESGLLCIEHNEAVSFLKRYVDACDKEPYSQVAEELKRINIKRVGLLAREFEDKILFLISPEELDDEIYSIPTRQRTRWIENYSELEKSEVWMEITEGKLWTTAHSEALDEMKKLFPNSDEKGVVIPDPDTAKCVIPDVVKNYLWESAVDIINWFGKIASRPSTPLSPRRNLQKKYGKRMSSQGTNHGENVKKISKA